MTPNDENIFNIAPDANKLGGSGASSPVNF